MLASTRIAVCLAIALGTASGAAQAHSVHHGKHTVSRASRAEAYVARGAVRGTSELYMRSRIQTVPSTRRCWGGSCSPDWRADDGS